MPSLNPFPNIEKIENYSIIILSYCQINIDRLIFPKIVRLLQLSVSHIHCLNKGIAIFKQVGLFISTADKANHVGGVWGKAEKNFYRLSSDVRKKGCDLETTHRFGNQAETGILNLILSS